MGNRWRSLINFLALVLKLSILPILLWVNQDAFISGNISLLSSISSALFIILGLSGIIISDLLLLRFRDGKVHFSFKNSRLVDVGFYARTRHPYLWFFFLFQYGNFLFYIGFSWGSLLYSIGLSLLYLCYLVFVQEALLVRSLGEHYSNYKKRVPIWYWRLKIEENEKTGFRPQLVWIFGMLFLRFWYGIKVQGIEHIPFSKPFLLVANHESYLDPFLFGIFVPFEIKFVATADVFATPLMRFLLRGTGSFPMRRHRQDLKSIRTMIRIINKGQVVCIFPEGGRSIDGSPLPILKETLKLIQRCKVPILPVHLDGAYEVWPRWAPNRRRGHVTVSFKQVIPLENQTELGSLETQISGAIFAKEKVFKPVRSRAIARGLDNLFWACHNCRTRNSIVVIASNEIRCSHCQTQWQIDPTYRLTETESSKSLDSITWIRDIEADILNYSVQLDPLLGEGTAEVSHLSSSIIFYKNDIGTQLATRLTLTLTDKRVILCQNQKPIESWSMSEITIFTMDYFNAVSIGVGGVRHSFTLPKHEIPLKWQAYFDTIKASHGNIVRTSTE
ncbi:MAG: 1-acyl-sn-glycerol-3-phosphate acyltransferase [Candidatus Marinimicrobia bacterium]|nr:1-acyl-sn-glycerol-3-phosphate acyltransferase [Candidatus Neomarinimicrobiota bacterium]